MTTGRIKGPLNKRVDVRGLHWFIFIICLFKYHKNKCVLWAALRGQRAQCEESGRGSWARTSSPYNPGLLKSCDSFVWGKADHLSSYSLNMFRAVSILLFLSNCVTLMNVNNNDKQFCIKCFFWHNMGNWNHKVPYQTWTPISLAITCVRQRERVSRTGRKTAVHMCWCIMLIHLFIAGKLVFGGLWINSFGFMLNPKPMDPNGRLQKTLKAPVCTLNW